MLEIQSLGLAVSFGYAVRYTLPALNMIFRLQHAESPAINSETDAHKPLTLYPINYETVAHES